MPRKTTSMMKLAALGLIAPMVIGCATDGTGTSTGGGGSGGGTAAATGSSGGPSGGGVQIPTLVNVNLQNILNDLSIKLNVDRNNIPVTAQVPIDIAADVCGVSVSVLSVSTGGQASCTAKTDSPALAQVVQQQMAAGGSVGGGAQGGANASTGGTSTGGAASGGSAGAGSGVSSGSDDTRNEGTPPPK